MADETPADETLAAALEREHHEIDDGIAAFAASLADGKPDAAPLTQAADALRRHIYLEERFLFPHLRAAGMVPPVFVMLREHGEIWKTLDALQQQLATDPAASADTCRQLEALIEAHNSKEEPIIYPQADAVLSAEASAELHRLIESGRMPGGWVAERAR